MAPVRIAVPVLRFDPLTARARLLVLDAAGTGFSFRAGQAVWLRRVGQADRKPYSVASAPVDLATTGILEFLVSLEARGEPGPHLAGVVEGTRVEVEGPLGGFDLPPSRPDAPVLLVGGGTGIAPVRSLWRELLARSPGEAGWRPLVEDAVAALEPKPQTSRP